MSADVTTTDQARELALRILSRRAQPLVVVSTTATGEVLFDITALRGALDGIAEVMVVETGAASKQVESLLPEKTQVFNGAARVYPPDFADDPVWTRSHLRFPQFTDTQTLIDDAMAQTRRRTLESAPPPALRRANAVVEGITAGGARAIARLDDGTVVTVTSERLPRGIPLDHAVRPGAPVTGILNGFELQPEPTTIDESLFQHDEIRLALVVKVTELRASVQLHPQLEPVVLRRRDVTTDDEQPVSEVLRVGQVVAVRLRREDGRALAASILHLPDGATVVPAPPLVTGGPPWLTAAAPAPSSLSDPVAYTVPISGTASTTGRSAATTGPSVSDPATSLSDMAQSLADAHARDLAALAHEITALRGDILALTNLVAGLRSASGPNGAELVRLQSQNAALQAQLSRERADHATTTTRLSRATAERKEAGRALREARQWVERDTRADVDEPTLRASIASLWAERTEPGERDTWPLRVYALGPEYLRSLAALDDGQLAKAVRASVDAVTGRDREIPGRDLHRLRSGNGGDDPYRTRPDGAKAWRASLKQNAPGARRLHYWELPDGSIELARVVHHDDTRA